MSIRNNFKPDAKLFARFALALTFLSAVADRFGLWGANGQENVAWGDWAHFLEYTAYLIFFLPDILVPVVAIIATIAEIALAAALILGIYLRPVAFASAGLLLSFAVTMTLATGIKAPLDYSVFTAAVCAILLGESSSKKSIQ